ncbi:hypothetical protein H6777_03475 [Candidatus Nomurabacteria bacterium]|nr:hypothetical protein [Candidatus Nomurabacteria bacterium]
MDKKDTNQFQNQLPTDTTEPIDEGLRRAKIMAKFIETRQKIIQRETTHGDK